MEYPKINTLFKREIFGNNCIIPEFTLPEFKWMRFCKFECTEKIDGTNIRIIIDWKSQYDYSISFGGRTDRAIIPDHLKEKLHSIFDDFNPNDVFEFKNPEKIILFGEGYGRKIQSAGSNYLKDRVDFILFDIYFCNSNLWLNRESCEDISKKIGIDIVPLIGYFTIDEAIEIVQKGMVSKISENKEFISEGLVLKTPDGLNRRNGQRIITKLKTCDFKQYQSVHNKNFNLNE